MFIVRRSLVAVFTRSTIVCSWTLADLLINANASSRNRGVELSGRELDAVVVIIVVIVGVIVVVIVIVIVILVAAVAAIPVICAAVQAQHRVTNVI